MLRNGRPVIFTFNFLYKFFKKYLVCRHAKLKKPLAKRFNNHMGTTKIVIKIIWVCFYQCLRKNIHSAFSKKILVDLTRFFLPRQTNFEIKVRVSRGQLTKVREEVNITFFF